MKILLIIVVIILLGGVGLYLSTPHQKREVVSIYQIAKESEPVVETSANMKLSSFVVYLYPSTDSLCVGDPIPVTLDKSDTKNEFQEINAITSLLFRDIPKEFHSAIIPGTTLNNLSISKGILSIDLNNFITLERSKSCTYAAREKQIVKTLSQFDPTLKIRILVDGVPVTKE